MQKTQADSEYRDRVDAWVSANAAKAIDWSVLLESLPSVYPALVRDSAIRLGLWSNVRHSTRFSETSPVGSLAAGQWQRGDLPTAHPLDSSWWFTDQAIKKLADWVKRLSSPGDLVALLGTPTLFHYLGREPGDRKILLVDRAAGMADSGTSNTFQADLLHSQPKLPAPAAVMVVDPPWYGPELRAFLWNARTNSTRGTKILLSIPPIGTRPEIDLEWKGLAVWCEEIGFRILERWPLALRYISPAFETSALRAGRVPACPIDWRRGDLILLECGGNRPAPSVAPKQELDPSWNDISIGRIGVRIRSAPAKDEASPILYELVPNSVLPSVSRRDYRLQEVALWTSGNRVFGSRNIPALRNIIEAMAIGRSAATIPMNKLSLAQGDAKTREAGLAMARLREVFETEALELEEWNRRLNVNMVQLAS